MKPLFRNLVVAAVFMVTTLPAFSQVGTNDSVLNPNRATAEELATVPHMDDALAEQIVAGRMYLSIMDLHTLLSAERNEEQVAEMLTKLFVPINLNAASNEEMLLVPGVGDRMAYEFDEYRPYAALIQFRREIGKYVDDEELARLEQYVFVPIDLNSASDEAILSIPGVGSQMLREFKEYRPYKNIEQFRREMGKYVSEEEVARMERYVTIGE